MLAARCQAMDACQNQIGPPKEKGPWTVNLPTPEKPFAIRYLVARLWRLAQA